MTILAIVVLVVLLIILNAMLADDTPPTADKPPIKILYGSRSRLYISVGGPDAAHWIRMEGPKFGNFSKSISSSSDYILVVYPQYTSGKVKRYLINGYKKRHKT
jgi:hypothetical protein